MLDGSDISWGDGVINDDDSDDDDDADGGGGSSVSGASRLRCGGL